MLVDSVVVSIWKKFEYLVLSLVLLLNLSHSPPHVDLPEGRGIDKSLSRKRKKCHSQAIFACVMSSLTMLSGSNIESTNARSTRGHSHP
jgi:hypothetical protein